MTANIRPILAEYLRLYLVDDIRPICVSDIGPISDIAWRILANIQTIFNIGPILCQHWSNISVLPGEGERGREGRKGMGKGGNFQAPMQISGYATVKSNVDLV